LDPLGSFHCRNRKGAYKDGCKVTGLVYTKDIAVSSPPSSSASSKDAQGASRRKSGKRSEILVSTNDCRLRLVNSQDGAVHCKYKGVVRESMQIKASFSEDGKFIICGSEDGTVAVWPTQYTPSPSWYSYLSGRYVRMYACVSALFASIACIILVEAYL
jgi:WD40 repeat protein